MTDASAPAPVARIRLMIVDDQPLILRGLSTILDAEDDIEVVAKAVDGLDAIEQALATRPDVIVMDLQMPRASGVVATREITAKLPATGVVVLTTFDHDELVFEAIRAGARAYLLKDAPETEVLDTIRAVHRGESRLSPLIARKVMEEFRLMKSRSTPAAQASQPLAQTVTAGRVAGPGIETGTFSRDEPLTDKEERILQLIAAGKGNKQIGAAVFLAEGTVKNYVSRIMEKLHAPTRTELAVRAVGRRS